MSASHPLACVHALCCDHSPRVVAGGRYLTGLGVDFEFAASAFQYAEWKEATEYAGWLADVKEFLE